MEDYRSIARRVIDRSEKNVLVGYLDQGKVPSGGRGHTGPDVHPGMVISPALSDMWFDQDIAIHDHAMLDHVDPAAFAKLTEHEKAALLDFTYNTGGGPDGKGEWEIWRDVNAGHLADVPAQFSRFIYIHVDGVEKTSAGLKNRRAAETVLWNTGDVDATVATANAGGNTVCSAACRVLPTPPASVAPKSFARTSLGLKIGQLISGGGLTTVAARVATQGNQDQLQSVHDTVAAHSHELGHFGPALLSVLGAGIVLIAGAQFLVHLEQQAAAKV